MSPGSSAESCTAYALSVLRNNPENKPSSRRYNLHKMSDGVGEREFGSECENSSEWRTDLPPTFYENEKVLHSKVPAASNTSVFVRHIPKIYASYEVYEEVGCVSSDGSTRRADIIIIDRQKDKGVILDPQSVSRCMSNSHKRPQRMRERKGEGPTNRCLEEALRLKYVSDDDDDDYDDDDYDDDDDDDGDIFFWDYKSQFVK
ncbi:hypothetical protein ANN_13426 [Periplaneta americana]|uniref:Uncharacterized protein n=1 Tax=Periplaneta americana TaxID=6978 RepID=A0ABQ8TJV3_PERAM|nr:hypothetical protein ANN_13426 [Periplaneta americana]